MPRLSDGEKEFNWWILRAVIAVVVLSFLAVPKWHPIQPNPQRDALRHARR